MGKILLTNYPRDDKKYFKVVLEQKSVSIFDELYAIEEWAKNFHDDILVEVRNYNPYNVIGQKGKLILYFENDDDAIYFKLSNF